VKGWIRLQKNKFAGSDWVDLFSNCLPVEQILLQEPMSRHTTFAIGGPADCMVLPASAADAAEILRLTAQHKLPLTVIGKGSNLLVRDKGIRGLVLKIGEPMADLRCEANEIVVGAGALLADVAKFAAQCELTGMEFAVGIPGSIGGAVFMNAGAYDGEMSKVVTEVTAVCPDGVIRTFAGEAIRFGYRHSVFQENHCVICEVRLCLQKGNKIEIEATMADLTERRESKQPLEWPSAGSTFRRPPGHFAGTLVEQAGCKGLCCGGAKVSDKHAGFVINTGRASAAEVQELIRLVQTRVKEQSGVELWPEVIILGEE
jgi:UDP-N-acetylmuramate dehydrogenase